jgi:hypothetical protein
MKALSIRQPWAWLVIYAGKDIENRDWATRVRGRVLVHAAKGMTRDEYAEVREFCDQSAAAIVPDFDALQRGGIIGSVEILNCVEHSRSRWFFGRYGFVLANPKPLAFVPFKGSLGFFDVPDHLISGAA